MNFNNWVYKNKNHQYLDTTNYPPTSVRSSLADFWERTSFLTSFVHFYPFLVLLHCATLNLVPTCNNLPSVP